MTLLRKKACLKVRPADIAGPLAVFCIFCVWSIACLVDYHILNLCTYYCVPRIGPSVKICMPCSVYMTMAYRVFTVQTYFKVLETSLAQTDLDPTHLTM